MNQYPAISVISSLSVAQSHVSLLFYLHLLQTEKKLFLLIVSIFESLFSFLVVSLPDTFHAISWHLSVAHLHLSAMSSSFSSSVGLFDMVLSESYACEPSFSLEASSCLEFMFQESYSTNLSEISVFLPSALNIPQDETIGLFFKVLCPPSSFIFLNTIWFRETLNHSLLFPSDRWKDGLGKVKNQFHQQKMAPDVYVGRRNS